LTDNNPGSLEKALDALTAFLEKAKADLVSQNQIQIIKVITEKCLGHTKPAIKTKSLDCILLIFEISENFDLDTQDSIEELCKSKNAKVSKTYINSFIDSTDCNQFIGKFAYCLWN